MGDRFSMGDWYIGLDFETYSPVDLPKHGLDQYVSDPHFRVLVAATEWHELSGRKSRVFDFSQDPESATQVLREHLGDANIVAHNAMFEYTVLKKIGIEIPLDRFIDSAVIARAQGAGSKLEAAAPQLLNINKMKEGWPLIKLFSMPGKYQVESMAFDPQIVADHQPEWETFKEYCALDAQLSLSLFEGFGLTEIEWSNQTITFEMNEVGWPVDIDSVQQMQALYLKNQAKALEDFNLRYSDDPLNFNSPLQLKAWCAKRGIRSRSFDEKNVDKLIRKLTEKLEDPTQLKAEQASDYAEVLSMLQTKQILGGSSLKKLQTILDTVSDDGRLRDQYLHAGAGQTMRTSGRGVQMQNLKRFVDEPLDMTQLWDPRNKFSNDVLASNVRQVFAASHPEGQLIVGDFSSVEARGLAWAANEQWKLEAFRAGQDLYKVAAARPLGITDLAQITKAQRQFGKVGELSCGYQAGDTAVKDFAAGMGVELTEAEAARVVTDFRDNNPAIVNLWLRLDEALRVVVRNVQFSSDVELNDGYYVRLHRVPPPPSLVKQEPDKVLINVEMRLFNSKDFEVKKRVFVGCYMRGKDINFFKPSETKNGPLWKATYRHPKTGQEVFHKLYGGKLTGILIQSICREIFFKVLGDVSYVFRNTPNVKLIGQFHDEIVLEWNPSRTGYDLGSTVTILRDRMSTLEVMPSFPLAAEVNYAPRYIK